MKIHGCTSIEQYLMLDVALPDLFLSLSSLKSYNKGFTLENWMM